MWRVIFIFPTIQGIVTLALILLVFTEEPIGYCIMRGFNEMGMRHMQKLYRKKDPSSAETITEILELQYAFKAKSTTIDASSTTFKNAICGRKYRKASWVCFISNTFNQQTGINAIFIYANRLLVKMN